MSQVTEKINFNTFEEVTTALSELDLQSIETIKEFDSLLAEIREKISNLSLEEPQIQQIENQIEELKNKFEIQLISPAQLDQYLIRITHEHPKLSADQFNEILKKVDIIKAEGGDLKAISILISIIYSDERIFTPIEKVSLLRKNAGFYDDNDSVKGDRALAKALLTNEELGEGKLKIVCSGGQHRSFGLVNDIKAENGNSILVNPNPNIPIYDALAYLRDVNREAGITMALFSDERGDDVETFMNSLVNICMKESVLKQPNSIVIDLIRGNFSTLGIKRLILVKKSKIIRY